MHILSTDKGNSYMEVPSDRGSSRSSSTLHRHLSHSQNIQEERKGFQWNLFCVLCSTKKPRPPLFIYTTKPTFFLGWPRSRSRNWLFFLPLFIASRATAPIICMMGTCALSYDRAVLCRRISITYLIGISCNLLLELLIGPIKRQRCSKSVCLIGHIGLIKTFSYFLQQQFGQ